MISCVISLVFLVNMTSFIALAIRLEFEAIFVTLIFSSELFVDWDPFGLFGSAFFVSLEPHPAVVEIIKIISIANKIFFITKHSPRDYNFYLIVTVTIRTEINEYYPTLFANGSSPFSVVSSFLFT